MSKTIHAVLVGINAYEQNSLNGCINDVLAFHTFFKKLETDTGLRWNPKFLLAPHPQEMQAVEAAGISFFRPPTRQNLVDAFQHFHKDEVAADDICLFVYSGHGAQEPAPPELAHLKPDGMNETLVCLDSRLPGGRDLVDKDLAWLLWQATRRRPGGHFLTIMDCCHSGGNTRGDEENGLRSREEIPRADGTSFEKLLSQQAENETDRLFFLNDGRAFYKEEGNYIHLAAARDRETAKERSLDGQIRGAFIWSLLRVLERGGTALSYREIMRRAEWLVRNRVAQQIPQLDAPDKLMENSPFLGQNIPIQPVSYPVIYKLGKWRLMAGQLQGIAFNPDSVNAPNAAQKPVATRFKLTDGSEKVLTATAVFENYTVLDGTGLAIPDDSTDLQAELLEMPSPRISVFVEPEIPANRLAKFQEALATERLVYTDFDLKNRDEADFFVRFENDAWLFFRKGGSRPVFMRQFVRLPPVDGHEAVEVSGVERQFIQFCEAVGKWQAVLELQNAQTRIRRDDLEITAEIIENQSFNGQTLHGLVGRETSNPSEIELRYGREEDGRLIRPVFRMKIRVNKPGLWLGGLYMDTQFGIQEYLPAQEADPKNEYFLEFTERNTRFNSIPVSIPKPLRESGVMELTDTVKIFVSTFPFKLADFTQESLPIDTFRSEKAVEPVDLPDDVPARPDWATFEIPVKIILPPAVGDAATFQAAGFRIQTPDGFSAIASMSSAADIHRKMEVAKALGMPRGEMADWEKIMLPPASILGKAAADPQIFGRSLEMPPDSTLSILELTDLKGDFNGPILLKMTEKPADDEAIIPFGFDPETGLYLPLGGMNEAGDIEIHSLPPETPGLIRGEEIFSDRSFKGSVKLFFKKLFYGKPDNRLELVAPDLSVEKDSARIREKLATAREILFITHGIIGDTEDKRLAVLQATDIHTHFDAVLAFDFENLNTGLKETALDLKERLKTVGIFSKNERRLTIIAGSMGGLVCRWMIEKEGVAPFVRHFIMAGVPNLGSDIAAFRQRLFGLLGRVLNGSVVLKPYLIPLSFLLKKGEKAFFHTLDEMHENSPFLAALNSPGSPEPAGIRYSLLAGNTKEIHLKPGEAGSFWKRLKHFMTKRLTYTVLDRLVFDTENDMAVEVESQKGQRWLRPENTRTVGVDHVSYFIEPEGLAGLKMLVEADRQTA